MESQIAGQLGLLSIPCPACNSELTIWLEGDLWECPHCGYEWHQER